MNGSTLSYVLQKDPFTKKWYQGHAAPDTNIEPLISRPALIVLNTDLSSGPGEHWCIAVIFSKTRTEFFDSFGISPDYYCFTSKLLEHSESIHYNQFPVQSDNSTTCGHHCLFWSLLRARGISAKNIMQLYNPNNPPSNDLMVFNFIKENFGDKYAGE